MLNFKNFISNSSIKQSFQLNSISSAVNSLVISDGTSWWPSNQDIEDLVTIKLILEGSSLSKEEKLTLRVITKALDLKNNVNNRPINLALNQSEVYALSILRNSLDRLADSLRKGGK